MCYRTAVQILLQTLKVRARQIRPYLHLARRPPDLGHSIESILLGNQHMYLDTLMSTPTETYFSSKQPVPPQTIHSAVA